MPAELNLLGHTFGRLRVIDHAKHNSSGKTSWLCKCECGNTIPVTTGNLRSGTSQSCGCLQRERTGNSCRTHGMAHKIPEYEIWKSMKRRCLNVKDKNYKHYGERGITICERWLNSFENFFADMGAKPTPKHSLDRKDNDGEYGPDNCRWATKVEQMGNTRRNRWIEYNGKRMILSDWARLFGLSSDELRSKLKHNSMENIFIIYTKKYT